MAREGGEGSSSSKGRGGSSSSSMETHGQPEGAETDSLYRAFNRALKKWRGCALGTDEKRDTKKRRHMSSLLERERASATCC